VSSGEHRLGCRTRRAVTRSGCRQHACRRQTNLDSLAIPRRGSVFTYRRYTRVGRTGREAGWRARRRRGRARSSRRARAGTRCLNLLAALRPMPQAHRQCLNFSGTGQWRLDFLRPNSQRLSCAIGSEQRQTADLGCLSLSGKAPGGCGRWSATGCAALRRTTRRRLSGMICRRAWVGTLDVAIPHRRRCACLVDRASRAREGTGFATLPSWGQRGGSQWPAGPG
jgi:hypothetical protein